MRRPRLSAAVLTLALAVPFVVGAEDRDEDVRIVRDSFGVPHVYGPTRDAVAFGAGYALAQDRLWQMHTFRRIAKGQLSDLLGPAVVDIDRTVRFFTYTEEERTARFAAYPDDIRSGLQAFTDGINAWIGEAQRDPRALPFEFVEFGELPIEPWTVTDSVALQDVLILAFGSGGGNELEYAALAQRLVERYGEEEGLARFDDLIRTDDPDDPVTIPEDLDWAATPTGARVVEAESRRALTDDARISLADEAAADAGLLPAVDATSARPAAIGTRAQLDLVPDADEALRETAFLRRGLDALERMFSFGSNAQLVDPSLSETGNSLQTGGPQVGYLVPQWLADFGLHGGGLNTTGMTFAGAGPAVLIGRGHGYAWTTTTGASDLTDTFVERLDPDDPRRYAFRGRFEDMECRTETYTFRGVPFDRQEICRTRHGPVAAFDEDAGAAYALRYAWFAREVQTVEGFFRFNEVESLEDFATFANYLGSNHNMFYSDDQGRSGYWTPGNHPVRAAGVDLRLPQDGTGGSEWQGLRPVGEVPHAVDPDRGWMVNWNNAPAVGWERERTYPARDNVLDLVTAYEQRRTVDPRGGLVNPDGRWDFEDLSANLRHAAMAHHEHTWFRSALPRPGELTSDLARRALQLVRRSDGFLLDEDGDGRYDDPASTIVERWLDVAHAEVFTDDLGGDASFARIDSELWHVLSPESTLELRADWLGGRSPRVVAARTFEVAVAELAEESGSDDPKTWRRPAEIERYQRLNADLFTDLLAAETCGTSCAAEDSGFPGDIPEHLAMDRGTYNHVVHYLDRPVAGAPLGRSLVDAGSVIPPGQSGFISVWGQESPHYEDQLDEYVGWRYKPMPLSLAAARKLAESEEVVTYTPSSPSV